MVETLYIPAVTEQLTQLTTAIAQMKAAGIKAGMKATADRAQPDRHAAGPSPHPGARNSAAPVDKAETKVIQTGMDNLRSTIDMLESLTDADLWPFPPMRNCSFCKTKGSLRNRK